MRLLQQTSKVAALESLVWSVTSESMNCRNLICTQLRSEDCEITSWGNVPCPACLTKGIQNWGLAKSRCAIVSLAIVVRWSYFDGRCGVHSLLSPAAVPFSSDSSCWCHESQSSHVLNILRLIKVNLDSQEILWNIKFGLTVYELLVRNETEGSTIWSHREAELWNRDYTSSSTSFHCCGCQFQHKATVYVVT